MTKKPLISQDDAHRRVDDALRLRVGLGKRYSFASLSEATGISERTLRSYVDGEGGTTPGLAHFLSLCSVLGPGFTSDVLAACGQSARDGSDDDPEHMRVLTALGTLTAQIADAVEDGHVDHREAAAMRPTAQRLMEVLEPLARDSNTVPMRGKVS